MYGPTDPRPAIAAPERKRLAWVRQQYLVPTGVKTVMAISVKALIAGATMLMLPVAALAQSKPDPTVVAGSDEGTGELNRRAAADAAAQDRANDASAAQFNQAVADYEAQRTAVAEARARYEAQMEAHRQAQAAYDAAYARWQADVAACNAGDRSRCSTSAPATPK